MVRYHKPVMQALTFWKLVTVDQSNLLEQFIDLLTKNQIRFCVVGGQAVNAYVEPLVSLDLDIVVGQRSRSNCLNLWFATTMGSRCSLTA